MLGQPPEPTAAEEDDHLAGALAAGKAAEWPEGPWVNRSADQVLQARLDELEATKRRLREFAVQQAEKLRPEASTVEEDTPGIDWSASRAARADVISMLAPLCPCSYNPNSTAYGPQRECPLHGDGETFVRWVQEQEGELVQARGYISDLERRDVEHENLQRMLWQLCGCASDPNSPDYGPQQECPLHGDGVEFARGVLGMERFCLALASRMGLCWPCDLEVLTAAVMQTLDDQHDNE